MTEPLLSQVEVEDRMFYGGVKRAQTMMETAEKAGRAITCPYGQSILRDYVVPTAQIIELDLKPKVGRKRAEIALLNGLDPMAIALLGVRATINTCMAHGATADSRAVANEIGKSVHGELVLTQIEDECPELYHTMVSSLGRRLSKDERHRVTTLRLAAAKAGLVVLEWPVGARDVVGMYLLSLLEKAGMIVLDKSANIMRHPDKVKRMMHLSEEAMDKIDSIREHVALSAPVYGPCVEPPKPWTDNFTGGFHTDRLAKRVGCLVICSHSAKHLYRTHDMPVVRAAVNALQNTAWRINQRMLDTIRAIAAERSTGEIVGNVRPVKPAKPLWLLDDMDPDKFTEAQTAEFKAWKANVRDWHTANKLVGVKFGRFRQALRAAEMFGGYPTLYFVHRADSRGRLYPLTFGVSPQGSDLSKALLHFAHGKPVDTPEAILWFHVQGANKFGFDKATLEERKQWVIDRQDLILTFADDPVNNTGWEEAGDPLQFLAWCFEYAEWVRDRTGKFVSHLPISMDGSCNGLQHLSAMLRDEIGGKATNLTANSQMQDIYGLVAAAATRRMEATQEEDPERKVVRDKWLAHGIKRKVVKRSVMTTPYGVTRMSATTYVISDYLQPEGTQVHGFLPGEYRLASSVLMSHAWPAIGDIVVKGRQAMDWLKKSSKVIVKGLSEETPVITWVTPSGFLATQAYMELNYIRVNTRLAGSVEIKVVSETDKPDPNHHASGMAPNFIHSLDASHLHSTAVAASQQGIDHLAMIHDDYGTHAADATKLYGIIRSTFVDMYEKHDPLVELASQYDGLPPIPEKGTLDIRQVLKSQFFFS